MESNSGFIKLEYTKPNAEEMIKRSETFLKFMKQRRTVREISDEAIPDEVLYNIILTGGSAPSGANKQPWFFSLVKSTEMKRKIRAKCEELELVNYKEKYTGEWKKDLEFLRTNHVKEFLEKAPALIIVFKERMSTDGDEHHRNYYVSESSGIALGMLITAIHNAGLVTIPYTPMPRGFLTEMLDRPRTENAVMILPVGYPVENAEVPVKTTKTLDEIMKEY